MTPMFKHQEDFVNFAQKMNFCCCNWSDIGTGKTRMGIECFKRIRDIDQKARMMVICPLSLIESAWVEDIKKFSDFTYKNLHKELRDDGEDILLINYDAIITNKFDDFLTMLSGTFFCFLDESSKMKNAAAKTTKQLLFMRRFFSWRIVSSATPAPNSEMEYWAQVEFARPQTLHESFYGFRNTYFHLGRGNQILPNGALLGKSAYAKVFSQGWKYQITPKKKAELLEKIAQVSFRCDKDKCLDLPDIIDEYRKVEMTPIQRKHYNQLKNDLITEIKGKDIVAQVALVKIMKLRQVTSSFAITPDGDAIEIEGKNQKLDELKDILSEIGDKQVIIWANFHKEIEQITKELGDQARALYSLTGDKDETIRSFKSGGFKYLVAHPRSAGHGHTLINANIQIFYSLDYSWEAYEQSRGRIHRAGQTRKCCYVHILCENSIDEVILDCLNKKSSAFEMLSEVMK